MGEVYTVIRNYNLGGECDVCLAENLYTAVVLANGFVEDALAVGYHVTEESSEDAYFHVDDEYLSKDFQYHDDSSDMEYIWIEKNEIERR